MINTQWKSCSSDWMFPILCSFHWRTFARAKEKKKGERTREGKRYPQHSFYILSYHFKRTRLCFVLWYPISRVPFFPLILLQKNLQEQNGKDKRWKKRWLKVRYIHYFDIYEHVLVEHPNICSVKPAIINNGNRFRWRPTRWVRLQHRPIIALFMEWNCETFLRKNYDVTYLYISIFCPKTRTKA